MELTLGTVTIYAAICPDLIEQFNFLGLLCLKKKQKKKKQTIQFLN
jgi:hypothetical protein